MTCEELPLCHSRAPLAGIHVGFRDRASVGKVKLDSR